MNMALNMVKIEILKKFPSQADFAAASEFSEAMVSRILKGRRRLSQEEVRKWGAVLRCKPSVFEPIMEPDCGRKSD